MGKQINFYMSNIVENYFIELLKERGFIILWHDFIKNAVIKVNVTECPIELPKTIYLYKSEFGEYYTKESKYVRIDAFNSPVIEFSRTSINSREKKIIRGRLWIEPKQYDELKKMINKNTSFVKEFNLLVKWIKKNIPYQPVILGEHIINEYVNNDIRVLLNEGYSLSI